ncbi:MAG TPA: RNA-binding protein [Nanoarchaeota archaeon]|nr:RNA-binding protein [Nanoarchaeota archaeon]
MKNCISCKKSTVNDGGAIAIACPQCSTELIRCGQCRKTAVSYKCKCNLEGP